MSYFFYYLLLHICYLFVDICNSDFLFVSFFVFVCLFLLFLIRFCYLFFNFCDLAPYVIIIRYRKMQNHPARHNLRLDLTNHWQIWNLHPTPFNFLNKSVVNWRVFPCKDYQGRLPRYLRIDGNWKEVKVESRGIEPWTSGLASQHYTIELKRHWQYIGTLIFTS